MRSNGVDWISRVSDQELDFNFFVVCAVCGGHLYFPMSFYSYVKLRKKFNEASETSHETRADVFDVP